MIEGIDYIPIGDPCTHEGWACTGMRHAAVFLDDDEGGQFRILIDPAKANHLEGAW